MQFAVHCPSLTHEILLSAGASVAYAMQCAWWPVRNVFM